MSTKSAIKLQTQSLHDELEDLPFNRKMFLGEQTGPERAVYLSSMLEIFEVLDPHVPEDMRRSHLIDKDILKLAVLWSDPMPLALDYKEYLKGSNHLKGHIYLNYMGFLYGGQIMKKRYPHASSMYEFENIEESRSHIRQHFIEDPSSPSYPSFVSEVETGFNYHIALSKELGEYFHVG